ncbi:MAG: hypothetical protein JSV82_05260 [Planctomycetota bacterium]|nr:MAG: hypothetical protein JSV82_05260 [Planctomycetota bacterium]
MGFNRAKKRLGTVLTVAVAIPAFISVCFADTFTHQQTGQVLHGYATSRTIDNQTVVRTREKGLVKLNLAEWQITADREGRNNKVIVFTLDGDIAFQMETEAFEQAMVKAADEGPLFILLEIDTPGGRKDLAERICAAITQTRNCQVIAFVKGGEYGGAISAGAAVALACDKIYMANNTAIGAATIITISEKGPRDLKRTFGDRVGEKFSSAWRAKLASLAEQNNRPGLLARAMVDQDIEVIEVSAAGEKLFVEPINKKPQQNLVHTWSRKGSLLTLTAAEAVQCRMADKVVDSRAELLGDLDAADAKVVMNTDIQEARMELDRARGQLNRIRKSIDFKIKQSEHPQPARKVLSILRSASSEFKTLIKLAKKYPDLHLDIQALESELNSIEATYESLKRQTRRR